MFSKIKSMDWAAYRQNWLNWNTGFGILIYAIVAWVSLRIILLGASKVNLENEFISALSWLITLFPALLIVVVFGAYRGAYKGNLKDRRTVNRILTWRRYALPMTVLMCITTFFLAWLLYEDLESSPGLIRNGEFAFGTFPFPIYFGNIRIEIPSTILWFAFIGYLVTLTGVMLRRIVTNNLVPHFYLASSFRLLRSLVAAVLLVLSINGVPQLFPQAAVSISSSDEIQLALHPFYNILIAFVAGATADDIIGWIIYRVRKSIGRGGGEALSLSAIQGIDPTLEAYLREEGVDSIQMLATTPRSTLVEITNIPEETIEDWQIQGEFLRCLDSPEIVARFHRLGINEFADLEGLDSERLSKALAEAGKRRNIDTEVIYETLLDVLKGEAKRKS